VGVRGEFGYAQAARYTAFLQNLLMSVLFIAMFVGRRGARGQSMTIAIAKWIGTLAPTIVFGVHEDSAFILTLGVLCSVVDLGYIWLLAQARHDPARFENGVSAGKSRPAVAQPLLHRGCST